MRFLVARAKLNTVTGKALGESFAIQGEFETVRAGLELRVTDGAGTRPTARTSPTAESG